MQFKEIISVPGLGLFRILSSNKTGFIVESLTDGKRTMVNANQRIMTLSEIAVYTSDGEVPLRDVFKKIADSGKKAPDPKGDQEKLRVFFKTVVPDFDEERVYNSDIKKMITWYDLLKDKIDFKVEEKEEEGVDVKSHAGDQGHQIHRVHEVHGPKTEHAKTTTTKTRKKV